MRFVDDKSFRAKIAALAKTAEGKVLLMKGDKHAQRAR